ncbi:zinc ribbon domain-containing protein [Pseudobacteroides cellulosolvens]|uniref:Transposase IS605 OrfB n=1 Tax=Pseudobacteroides cellulosolvens ATCC 35603 = DSM 2933 TaxID=398512 RepID=A0A0L6JJ65_9FIRM|nr:zinc ribbon domain-containing protein [Pseudobacteroides cellulosolvens]KNY25718.1 transposase IS605 OrfB [Pseudobacteroides cellulosolvens ATCC 35603 = DSM 2933]
MGMRTIVLKLHKPSKAKQQIINDALLGYNKAFEFLINKAGNCLPELEQRFKVKAGQYNILALSKWIDSNLSQELNKFDVQPFKDSLRLEFAYAMADCLRTGSVCQENVNKEAAFSYFRPIYFCRYDTKRGYCLLYDKEKDRYYVKLYLLNGPNARTAAEANIREGLVHVHKDNKMLERKRRKETHIIVPLSFGKWQERIIKEASKAPECFKTARLLVRDNEYYLAISIEAGESKSISTMAYMGVSRGLKSNLHYTVVNSHGEIIISGEIDTLEKNDDSSGIPLNKLHKAANIITDIAISHKAQIIVQNLSQRGDGLGWSDNDLDQYLPRFKRKDYNRMVSLLEYKLQWKGLPKPIKVSPIGIYYTCCSCGRNSKKNRFNKDLLICSSCGTTMDIDKLGSLNLARKLIDYNTSKIKINIKRVDSGVVFSNKILGLDCFTSYKEDQLLRLKNEIQKIIEDTKLIVKTQDKKAHSARISLIRKLESVENFMDLIEYI